MRQLRAVAEYRADIYARSAIVDPYPHYLRLRHLGSPVWAINNIIHRHNRLPLKLIAA
ncbi:hypothetical protein MHPYR_90130 [uncultured Mycobacterium sp.]|uniref:Uncharacterized protein n=1 Tax=uncultured Mycobacterium sp. TaxID=171292 RepID=A0A1Y5PQU1_9MYCO|nr:hypothetical protein MHPYR_90130 [uncultured Mycobacterium sp.]